MKSHYNTTGETDPLLRGYKRKALTQQEKVLRFFQKFPTEWSPTQVQRFVLPDAPTTSARRAMTNLTDAGFLRKTDRKRKGLYGRPEHLWVLQEKGDE